CLLCQFHAFARTCAILVNVHQSYPSQRAPTTGYAELLARVTIPKRDGSHMGVLGRVAQGARAIAKLTSGVSMRKLRRFSQRAWATAPWQPLLRADQLADVCSGAGAARNHVLDGGDDRLMNDRR